MRPGELVYADFGHQRECRRSGSLLTARRNERAKPPRVAARRAHASPQAYAPRPSRR